LISREQALRTLRKAGCRSEVVEHCQAVARQALELAEKIQNRGHKIDLRLVEVGALLHDVGRARTHGIRHGIIGADILRDKGLERFACFAENHLGAGIPAAEAKGLGLPAKDFTPKTLEEKVVVYADKLVKGRRSTSYDEAVRWFKKELGPSHPALQRFEILHRDIQRLLGTV
jgi:uncharacterized protein